MHAGCKGADRGPGEWAVLRQWPLRTLRKSALMRSRGERQFSREFNPPKRKISRSDMIDSEVLSVAGRQGGTICVLQETSRQSSDRLPIACALRACGVAATLNAGGPCLRVTLSFVRWRASTVAEPLHLCPSYITFSTDSLTTTASILNSCLPPLGCSPSEAGTVRIRAPTL